MTQIKNTIVEETQREAVLNRPHNLAGAVERVSKERFSITKDSVQLGTVKTVPALIKIISEAIDNPIDVFVKSSGSKGNKIDIKVTKDTFTISDNGFGIPTSENELNENFVYVATCKYNSSSNYVDENTGQKGVNGLGIKLSNTLSTHFKVISDDGSNKVTVVSTKNNLEHDIKKEPSTGKTGVTLSFKPDFNIFECNEIDQEHIDRIFEYVLIQALTYPEITFKFNGKMVKYTPKQFLGLFEQTGQLYEDDDYFFSIMHNSLDDFRQVSYVNGLETTRGGSHIDYVMTNVVNRIRDKLIKKHKTIKPGDIRNKLQLVIIAKNFRGAKWDGQTKESITNPVKDLTDFFQNVDWDKYIAKVLKDTSIIEPITEVYRIKEELKKRQELKKLDKSVKKIKSEKYLPPIGKKKYLMIAEGDSAKGGLEPVLGRQECGYYTLKGKPLNSYQASHQKFSANVELTELYKIVQNEDYDYIIYATDQDLDGYHIRGLLTGFFLKYLPDYKNRLGMLQTPIIGVTKNDKLVNWFYSLNNVKLKKGEVSSYYKGLGTWDIEDLKTVIAKDGLSKMIELLEFDDEEIVDDWLSKDKVDARKEYILNNDFSIAKV